MPEKHGSFIEWIERQQRPNPNDRGFSVLDELVADSLPASSQTDPRGEADLVAERHDHDESFTTADDRPEQS